MGLWTTGYWILLLVTLAPSHLYLEKPVNLIGTLCQHLLAHAKKQKIEDRLAWPRTEDESHQFLHPQESVIVPALTPEQADGRGMATLHIHPRPG